MVEEARLLQRAFAFGQAHLLVSLMFGQARLFVSFMFGQARLSAQARIVGQG